MTIEQKPELNRYIDPSIPLTWAYRKRAMKALPLIIFASVTIFLRVLVRDLTTDSQKHGIMDAVSALAAALLSFPVIFFGAMEFETRMRHRSKRKLQILDRRIVITPARIKFFKWKRISKFEFRPVMGEPNLTVLDLFAVLRNSKPLRWAMVLDNRDQVQALVRQLENKKLESHLDYKIEISKEPFEMEPLTPVSLKGGLMGIAGLILLLNGMVVLFCWMNLIGFLPPPDSSHIRHSSSPLGRFVAAHFSSLEAYKQFLLVLGGSLSAAGLGLLVWGNRIIKGHANRKT